MPLNKRFLSLTPNSIFGDLPGRQRVVGSPPYRLGLVTLDGKTRENREEAIFEEPEARNSPKQIKETWVSPCYSTPVGPGAEAFIT